MFRLGSTYLIALPKRGMVPEDAGRFAAAICVFGDALMVDCNFLWPTWTEVIDFSSCSGRGQT